MAITKQEFLWKIRTKYPAYEWIDDTILFDKITTKYPQYKSQISDTDIQAPVTETPAVDPITQVERPKMAITQLPGAIKSVASKTVEAAKWWIGRIKEAWVWAAEGKYTPWEAAIRGWAWALQTAFSPVAWIIWEWIERLIPDSFKSFIAEKAQPTIDDAKDWYEWQSPEQKRSLDNAWVWLEMLTYALWAQALSTWAWKEIWKQVVKKVAKKTIGKLVAPIAWQAIKKWQWIVKWMLIKPVEKIQAIKAWITKTLKWVEKRVQRWSVDFKWEVWKTPIIKPIRPIAKKVDEITPTFREKVSWLKERDIAAVKDTPEFTGILEKAKESVKSDYKRTPYWEWAKKAETAFKKLEDNLNVSYKEKANILKWNKTKINTVWIKQEIQENLWKKLNIEYSKDWLREIKWRWAQIDINNKADLRALDELNKVINSKTPLEFADRIQAMQAWIYDNSSKLVPGWVSDKMQNFIRQSTWIVNKNLKEQLPSRYAQIMKEMSEDIGLRQSLDRVFKVTWEGNRWELAMKRLVAWTTTSWDVKSIALAVKEKLGIDLIKEARMRQLAMQLAWDNRAETLFWAIEKGWVLGAWSKILKEAWKKTFFDPEKLVIKRAWWKKIGKYDKEFIWKPKKIDSKQSKK